MWRKWMAERRARRVPQQQMLDLPALAMRVSVLEDSFDKLEGQYKSLRGYVYAKKGLVGPPGEPPPGDVPPAAPVEPSGRVSTSKAPTSSGPAPESRDELRRRLTREGVFIPGKPPVHREG